MSYIIDSGKYVMLESAWSSFSINQSQKCVSLLYVFPENSLTALDSPKTEKEIKVCCKCLKSRINNVSLKWSLCNCYLTCALPDGGGGFRWWKCDKILVRGRKFSSTKLLLDEYFYQMNIFTKYYQIIEIFGGKRRNFITPPMNALFNALTLRWTLNWEGIKKWLAVNNLLKFKGGLSFTKGR